MVEIIVGLICCNFFSMDLIVGLVLVSCGKSCDFAFGGGFWSRCGRRLAWWQ